MESEPDKQHKTHDHKHKPSSSELLSSAKVIAEAAKAGLHHETDKIDKAKVAGATADLIGAASSYGKLEEKGVGKYMEKAEHYLHQYHSSTTTHSAHSTTTTTSHSHSSSTAHSSHSGDGNGGKHSESSGGFGDYIKMAQGFAGKHGEGGKHSESSGGFGDYIKMAQGFAGKHGEGGKHSESSGGYDDYIKLAQGLLKKH